MDTEPQKEHKGVTKDDLYTQTIGEFGKWQTMLFLPIALPIKLTMPWIHFGIIFMAAKTDYRCLSSNSSIEILNSTCYEDCVEYEYFSDFESTIISEWDLICDRAWMANFTQSMCMFGVLVGSIVFGFISDRYGRRPGVLSSCMLQLISSSITPFCPNYWSLAAMRFALGASTAGSMMSSFIFLMEIVGPAKRELLGCLYSMPLAIGHSLMAVMGYYLRSWISYSVGVALPSLVYLTYVYFMPESPKWLISVGRLEEASVVMSYAAKFNGIEIPLENTLLVVETIAKMGTMETTTQRKATYMDLIRLPSLRVKNLCCCLLWLVIGIGFYGGTQYFGQTSSNTFLSVALGGLVQIPGLPLSAYVSKKFGRRVSIIGMFLISSVCNFLLIIPDEWFYVKLFAGSIAVACGAAAFSVVYVYTTELFPTVARNMAMGTSSTTTRVGSMLAPFIGELNIVTTWIPPIVFGTAPILGVIACYLLPETKGKPLEDHLDESR